MQTHINNASVYVDVVCHTCKKRMALGNASQYDGRYYCQTHYPFSSMTLKQLAKYAEGELEIAP